MHVKIEHAAARQAFDRADAIGVRDVEHLCQVGIGGRKRGIDHRPRRCILRKGETQLQVGAAGTEGKVI